MLDLIAIDFGSENLRFSHQHYDPQSGQHTNIKRVELADDMYTTSSIAVWHKPTESWIFGHEFDEKRHILSPKDIVVVQHSELLLCDGALQTTRGKQAKHQLEKTLRNGQEYDSALIDLLSGMFDYLWRNICEALDKRGRPRSLETYVSISVPKSIATDGQAKLRCAAKKAGFPSFQLVNGSLSAAAAILQDLMDDPFYLESPKEVVSHCKFYLQYCSLTGSRLERMLR